MRSVVKYIAAVIIFMCFVLGGMAAYKITDNIFKTLDKGTNNTCPFSTTK